jgi:DNA-binding transcriptional LysR family regulator
MNENADDVATQIHSDYSGRLMAMLRDGLINVAVLYEPQRNPDVLIEEFAREDIVLVSSVPRSVQRTPIEGYVYVDWGHRFRLEHTAAYPDNPTHQMTVGMASVGLGQILEQGGSAYLLDSEVQQYIDCGELFLVEGAATFTLTTYLAYFTDAIENPAVQEALTGLNHVRR